MRRLATGLDGTPGQVATRIAEDDFDLVPFDTQDVCRRTSGVGDRVGPQVSAALMDFDDTVFWPDHQETVEPAASRRVRAHSDTYAGSFRAVHLSTTGDSLFPIEALAPQIDCFLDENTAESAATRSVLNVRIRGVQPPKR